MDLGCTLDADPCPCDMSIQARQNKRCPLEVLGVLLLPGALAPKDHQEEMCDGTNNTCETSGRRTGATQVIDVDGEYTGEIVVSRENNVIELMVSGAGLPKAQLYAFDQGDTIAKFAQQLAADLIVPTETIELRTPSGASLNQDMSHAFAWKPGRVVLAGDRSFSVSIVTLDDGEIDHFSPSVTGRRSSLRVAHPPVVKYIVVSGGVVSGLGKGVTASSLGVLMRAAGYRPTHIKIDPYLNVDAGTMSPFEHGEVFTLDDGGEVDLDLGNYERFNELTYRARAASSNPLALLWCARRVLTASGRIALLWRVAGSRATITSPRARFTRTASTKSAAATTWGRRCRWCHT